MIGAHGRERFPEGVGGCWWPSVGDKTVGNTSSRIACTNIAVAILGLRKTSCEPFCGCPWWWRCWGVLRGVVGGGVREC